MTAEEYIELHAASNQGNLFGARSYLRARFAVRKTTVAVVLRDLLRCTVVAIPETH
jgi:hypothetical protein